MSSINFSLFAFLICAPVRADEVKFQRRAYQPAYQYMGIYHNPLPRGPEWNESQKRLGAGKTIRIPTEFANKQWISDGIYNNFHKAGSLGTGLLLANHVFIDTYEKTGNVLAAQNVATLFIERYQRADKEGRFLDEKNMSNPEFLLTNLEPLLYSAAKDGLAKSGVPAQASLQAVWEIGRQVSLYNALESHSQEENWTKIGLSKQRYREFADWMFAASQDKLARAMKENPQIGKAFMDTFAHWNRIDPSATLDQNMELDPDLASRVRVARIEENTNGESAMAIHARSSAEMLRRMMQEARDHKLELLNEESRRHAIAGMHTTVRTATFVARITGNPEEARKLSGIGHSLVDAYSTIAEYRANLGRAARLANDAGKAATQAERLLMSRTSENLKLKASIDLLGGLVNVAGFLLDLFSTGPTIEEIILKEIRQLSSDVHSMQLQFQESFAHVDRRFDGLFNLILSGFSILSGEIHGLNEKVQSMREHLAVLHREVIQMDNALAEYAYDSAILKRTESVEKCLGADSLMSAADFRDCISQFKVLALNYSTSAPIAGVGESVLKNAVQEIWSGRTFFSSLSARLNDFTSIDAASRGMRLAVEAAEVRYGLMSSTAIVNADEWSTVCDAFTQFVQRHSDLVAQDTNFVLERVRAARAMGDQTQSAIHRLTVPKIFQNDGKEVSLSPIRTALLEYSHAVQDLERTVAREQKNWEAEHLGGHSINLDPNSDPKLADVSHFSGRSLEPCEGFSKNEVILPIHNNVPTDVLINIVPKKARLAAEAKAITLSFCYDGAEWTKLRSGGYLSDRNVAIHEDLFGHLEWIITVKATSNDEDRKTQIVSRRRYVSKDDYKYAMHIWKKHQGHAPYTRQKGVEVQDRAREIANASVSLRGGPNARMVLPKDWNAQGGVNYWAYGGILPNRDGKLGVPDWTDADLQVKERTGRRTWMEHALHQAWADLNQQPLNWARFESMTTEVLNEEQRNAALAWLTNTLESRVRLVRAAHDSKTFGEIAEQRRSDIDVAMSALDGAARFVSTLVALAYPNALRSEQDFHVMLYGNRQLADRHSLLTNLSEEAGTKTLDPARTEIFKVIKEHVADLDKRLGELESLPRKHEVLPKIHVGQKALSGIEARLFELNGREPLVDVVAEVRNAISRM